MREHKLGLHWPWTSFFRLLCFISCFQLTACSQGSSGGSDAPAVINYSIEYLLNNNSAPARTYFTITDAGSSSITWDFGDGSTPIVGNTQTSHEYQSGDTYLVKALIDGSLVAFRSVTINSREISGQIFKDRTAFQMDTDVNDRLSSPISNNEVTTAQALTFDQSILGHLRKSNALLGNDYPGLLASIGDTKDWYHFQIDEAGRFLHLMTLQPIDSLSISIYNSDTANTPAIWTGNNATEETLSIEMDSIGGPGHYWVQVSLESASFENYILTLNDLSTGIQSAAKPKDPFVIGQAIVHFRESRQGRSLTKDRLSSEPALIDITDLDTYHGRAFAPRTLPKVGLNPEDRRYPRSTEVSALEREHTLNQIRLLNSHPDIEIAEPNYIRTLIRPKQIKNFTPTDEYFNLQWHYSQIDVPNAWSLLGAPFAAPGTGVEIAIIDTGALPLHPDYSTANEGCNGGFDFISSPSQALDGNGWDDDPTDTGDLYLSYHGSHVAGTIGANTHNNIGVAGIAWGASLCHLRVLGLTGGTEYDLLQAIRYAAALPGDYEAYLPKRSKPVDIINLSLGGSTYSETENATMQVALNQGVFIVAAMGNEGDSSLNYPAAYSGVIGVAASNSKGQVTSYSNTGTHVDLTAPGGEMFCPSNDAQCAFGDIIDENEDNYPDGVLSLSANGYDNNIEYLYSFYEGTSMATPHVSAVIALMKQAHPNLSNDSFMAMLQQGLLTNDIDTEGFDIHSGYGEIDAFMAVRAAQNLGSTPSSQQILLSNAAPEFETSGTETIELTNLSETQTQVTDISVSKTWMNAQFATPLPVSLLPNSTETLTIKANVVELNSGSNDALITLTFDDASTRTILVKANIPPEPLTQVGTLYIVLLNEDGALPEYANQSMEYAIQQLSPDENGEYHFTLTSAGSGDAADNFLVYASTDIDGDGVLCEFGEFCAGLDFTNIQSFAITSEEATKHLYGRFMVDDEQKLSVTIPDNLFE